MSSIPGQLDREIHVKIFFDERGEPIVNQQLPADWPGSGVVPLLIKASVNGADAMLTPCANMTAKQFTITDPYVLRFADFTRKAVANR